MGATNSLRTYIMEPIPRRDARRTKDYEILVDAMINLLSTEEGALEYLKSYEFLSHLTLDIDRLEFNRAMDEASRKAIRPHRRKGSCKSD